MYDPSVEQALSLNHVDQHMINTPIKLISTYALEDPKQIMGILTIVDANFPVLLDMYDRNSTDWKVFVLWYTLVIGLEILITYSVTRAQMGSVRCYR